MPLYTTTLSGKRRGMSLAHAGPSPFFDSSSASNSSCVLTSINPSGTMRDQCASLLFASVSGGRTKFWLPSCTHTFLSQTCLDCTTLCPPVVSSSSPSSSSSSASSSSFSSFSVPSSSSSSSSPAGSSSSSSSPASDIASPSARASARIPARTSSSSSSSQPPSECSRSSRSWLSLKSSSSSSIARCFALRGLRVLGGKRFLRARRDGLFTSEKK